MEEKRSEPDRAETEVEPEEASGASRSARARKAGRSSRRRPTKLGPSAAEAGVT